MYYGGNGSRKIPANRTVLDDSRPPALGFLILMPVVIFTGLVGLFTGVMNSLKRFGLPAFATSLAAAGIMGLAVWGVDGLLVGWVQSGTGGLGLRVAVGIFAGVVVYAGSAALGRIPELGEARDVLSEALRRSSPGSG